MTGPASAAGCVAGAYVIGTLPTASLVGRTVGHDPTREGSGNPGASNVYRLAGRRAGATVFAVDAAKGALAGAAGLAVGDRTLAVATGAAAVVGHVFPLTRRMRGGRGVATALGFVVVAYPLVGLAAGAVWAAIARVTRLASVASIVVAAAIPVGVASIGRGASEITIVAAVSALLIVRHADNIGRLSRREERVLPGRGSR